MDWNAIENVVVPVDLEIPDDRPLRLALQAATRPEGVHVVYVVPQLEPSLIVQIDEAHRRDTALGNLKAWVATHGVPGVTCHALVGRPPRAIADFARQVGADLVILNAKSHQAVHRALIGSVAERTMRLAPCPVLLLHEQ